MVCIYIVLTALSFVNVINKTNQYDKTIEEELKKEKVVDKNNHILRVRYFEANSRFILD